MINRREFLVGCGGSLVVAGLGMGNTWAASIGAANPAVGIGVETWKSLLNQGFTLYLSAKNHTPLTLVALKEIPQDPNATVKLTQFSLTFLGRQYQKIQEGTYWVMHPLAGNFLVHLQPAGHDAHGIYYRSDFNLLV